MSLKQIEESKEKAANVRAKLTREGLRGRGREEEEEGGAGGDEGDEGTSPKRRKIVIDVLEREEVEGEDENDGHNIGSGDRGVSCQNDEGEREQRMDLEDSDELSNLDLHQTSDIGGSGMFQESYVFAVHRRLVSCTSCRDPHLPAAMIQSR